ncbi:hypothetical protein EJ05DRAFT_418513, partial [Pseudovirgaria hyperparasitica]
QSTMPSPAAASLMLQAEKALPVSIRPDLFAYCPTMDMLAIVTEEEVLEVYRLNGQRAFTRKRKHDSLVVQSICWKFNGKSIAIAWSDCTVDVLSTETGKLAPQPLEARRGADVLSDATRISCLAWESNFINVHSIKSRVNSVSQDSTDLIGEDLCTDDWDAPNTNISLNDVIQGHLDSRLLDPTPDLPDQIALIDLERLLPKLSVLSGPTLGPFVRPALQPVPELCVVPLTFRYIASAGLHVHLIGSKQQQLENLLRYIQECLRSISNFWYHSQDLPSKFMRNINETLTEKDEGDLMQNLFHLAVTGHCPPLIKEWLVDELTESGHKRWDHSATQGYAKVIELTHENLIPALDRCGIVVSLLRGLAAYNDSGSVFNVPASDFTSILETLKILRVLGHVVLVVAREERRQFTSFSRWLRDEIDVQASSSSSTEDPPERDSSVDYTLVLDFIRGPMISSKLNRFLRRQPKIDHSWSLPQCLPTYDEICKFVEPSKLAPESSSADGADTWLSLQRLHAQCQSAFAMIARWQASNTSMSFGLVLEDDEICDARDMRMTESPASFKRSDSLATYVAAVPSSARHEIRLHRLLHPASFDHLPDWTDLRSHTVILPPGAIRDVRFVDDEYVMALFRSSDNTSVLVSIPYAKFLEESPPHTPALESRKITDHVAPHGSAPSMDGVRTALDISQSDVFARYTIHTFVPTDRFVPLRLEVNGRKHRRVACVVGEDLKHYKVYDLDWVEGDGRE